MGAAASSSSAYSTSFVQLTNGSATAGGAALANGEPAQANQTNHIVDVDPGPDGNELPMFQYKEFEKQVSSAKRGALLVAGLQILSRFLGFCALTWATVVLLGGFASALRLFDFYLVSALLLVEGIRLFIVQVFSKLLSRAFFREPNQPEGFKFFDRQPSHALRLDLLGQALGFLLATASLVATIVRLSLSRSHGLSQKKATDPKTSPDAHSNLPTSLRIFYTVVILNAVFAMVSALLRPFFRWGCHGKGIFSVSFLRQSSAPANDQDSLKCYHDEVYKTAMEEGLPEADQLNFLDFAFRKLASDYKRNIRPPLILDMNRDTIRYLYNNQQGIAMASEYLKAGDVWQQQVAANLPGFWAEEERMELQMALFWALRERIYGAGKDAEAALNSIECLGQQWAAKAAKLTRDGNSDGIQSHPFLIKDPATGTNVVDTLVHLLLDPVRPTLLFQVRAFEACCRHPLVLRHLYFGTEAPAERLQAELANANTICGHLQAVIIAGSNQGAAGRQAGPADSRLQMLCRKLHSVVGPAPKPDAAPVYWAATKIYAVNALMTLLCYGRQEFVRQPTRDFFANMVKVSIDPASAPLGSNGEKPYFWERDLMVVENLRWRLGLDPYHRWSDVRLMQTNGREVLSHNYIIHLQTRAGRNLY